MVISIANDHTAVDMKDKIKEYLISLGHTVIDEGVNDTTLCDYPIQARKGVQNILDNKANLCILICGTGVGMSIAANKVKGIRAVVCSESYSARLSREHNNANTLCIGSRVIGIEVAKDIVNSFISSSFQKGRHETRVNMLE